MNLRLFFAVLIPKETKTKIEQELYPLLKPFQQEIKIVSTQNLHLTLRFLGYWPEEKAVEMEKKLEGLCKQPSFEIELEGIGSFHNRVLWIGSKKGNQEMEALARIVSRGLELPEEPFSSHLTLVKNKNLSSEEWKKMEQKLEEKKFKTAFRVNAVHLMQSELKPSGSEYKSVFEWKLKAP